MSSSSEPMLSTTSPLSGEANSTQSFLISQMLSTMYFARPAPLVPPIALPCRIKLMSISSADLNKS